MTYGYRTSPRSAHSFAPPGGVFLFRLLCGCSPTFLYCLLQFDMASEQELGRCFLCVYSLNRWPSRLWAVLEFAGPPSNKYVFAGPDLLRIWFATESVRILIQKISSLLWRLKVVAHSIRKAVLLFLPDRSHPEQPIPADCFAALFPKRNFLRFGAISLLFAILLCCS